MKAVPEAAKDERRPELIIGQFTVHIVFTQSIPEPGDRPREIVDGIVIGQERGGCGPGCTHL